MSRAGIGVDPLGLTGSLQAPGLSTPVTPVQPSEGFGEALEAFLGAAGQISSVLSRKAAADRQELIRDEADKVVRRHVSNQSAPEFETEEAQTLWFRMKAGKVAIDFDPEQVPQGPNQTPGEAFSAWIADQSVGHPPAYGLELARLTQTRFGAWHARQVEMNQAILYEEGIATLAHRATFDNLSDVQPDTDKLAKMGAKFGQSPVDVARQVWLPAIDALIANGNVKRVEALADIIESVLPDQAAKARQAVRGRFQQLESEQIRENIRKGVDPAITHKRIQDLGDADLLDETGVSRLTGVAQAAKAEQFASSIAPRLAAGETAVGLAKEAQALNQKGHVTFPQMNAIISALNTGRKLTYEQVMQNKGRKIGEDLLNAGKGGMLPDFPYDRPDGSQGTVKGDKTKEDWLNREMLEIEARHEITGSNPMDEQIHAMNRNAITYKPWGNMWRAGRTAATTANLLSDRDKPGAVPENSLAGFSHWKQVSTKDPRLAADLIDPQTEMFYKSAQLLEEVGFEPAAALLTAGQALGNPKIQINKSALNAAVKTITQTGIWPVNDRQAINTNTVFQRVENLAQILAATGISNERAAEEAGKMVAATTVILNGYAVNTRNMQLPRNFVALSEDLLDRYDDIFGTEEGVTRDALSLVPSPDRAGWIVYNNGNSQPVRNWQTPNIGAFTSVTLARISDLNERRDIRLQSMAEERRKLRRQIDSNPTVAEMQRLIEAELTEKKAGPVTRAMFEKALVGYRQQGLLPGFPVGAGSDLQFGPTRLQQPLGDVPGPLAPLWAAEQNRLQSRRNELRRTIEDLDPTRLRQKLGRMPTPGEMAALIPKGQKRAAAADLADYARDFRVRTTTPGGGGGSFDFLSPPVDQPLSPPGGVLAPIWAAERKRRLIELEAKLQTQTVFEGEFESFLLQADPEVLKQLGYDPDNPFEDVRFDISPTGASR